MSRKAFLKNIRKPAQRVSLTIPEWLDEEEKPLKVFFTPNTPADEVAVADLIASAGVENHQSGIYHSAFSLIHKLEDEKGRSLMTPGDLNDLMDSPSAIVGRIARHIGLGTGDDIEEMIEEEKKPSEATESDS